MAMARLSWLHRRDAAATDYPRWWRWVAWGLAALVLGAVFLAYLSPHLAVDLANRVWSCF